MCRIIFHLSGFMELLESKKAAGFRERSWISARSELERSCLTKRTYD